MQAVVFEQSGIPEDVLFVRNTPQPMPDRDQVLIRVSTRTIQPADFLFIEGRYRIKPVFPQVAGLEGTGTVVACGTEVSAFKLGERVAFRSPGAWAEFAVAPIARVYHVPSAIPDTIASQFALNPLTAWGLLAECALPESSRILITAGRSVVARILTKLAQRKRLKVSLLVREGSEFAVLDGDDGRVIAKAGAVAEVLATVVKNGFFHAILDSVGGENTVALIDALEPRGRLISYGILDDSDITIKASRVLYKNMLWQGFGIDGWLNNASKSQLESAQRELWEVLSDEQDLLPVIQSYALSDIQEAIHVVRKPHQPGKVLLTG